MLQLAQRNLAVLATLVIATITGGCATTGDQRVDLLYLRAANATGGSGDLYVVEEAPPPTGGTNTIQWVLGEIRNKDGKRLGNMISDTAPEDTLAAALVQEFKSAGYNTVQVKAIPNGVPKGVVLKGATIRVDEVKSASSFEAKCKVTASVQPWSNGTPMNKVEYEADYTESAVTGRDELPSKTLLHAIQTVMKRAVPDLVKTIEQR